MSRLLQATILFGMSVFFCLSSVNAVLAADDCADGTRLEQSFQSGASWVVCAQVSDLHALAVSSVHYRAPGDSLRSVLSQAQVAQVLMHYHDEQNAREQIGIADGARLLNWREQTCSGQQVLDGSGEPTICSIIQQPRVLARYAQQPSLLGSAWEISSSLQRDGLVWLVSITFGEDGQITPAVTLSGKARQGTDPATTNRLPASGQRLARATVLATWRLAFDLDGGSADNVKQFDFVLDPEDGNRRPMQITQMDSERFSNVQRDDFRGWLVSDPILDTGYYLDPSNSGFSYVAMPDNWTQYDLAVTTNKPCERYASGNQTNAADSTDTCGDTLDDFVNAEPLDSVSPVLWYSQSRTFNPGNEDWPVISHFRQAFTLLPYDWTSASPFEVVE